MKVRDASFHSFEPCQRTSVSVRLMAATALTGTFTYAPFRLPLLPTAPALAPAPATGGLAGELAGPDPPGSGDAGVQETPEDRTTETLHLN